MRRLTTVSVLVAAAALSGCSTSPRRSYGDVEGMIKERTSADVRLNPPADNAADPVKALLAQPLTAERAAQIALLRNAAFKVKLQEVGLAQSELAQAAILENPRFHAAWRYPKSGGAQSTGRELGVTFNILDHSLDFSVGAAWRGGAPGQRGRSDEYAHGRQASHQLLSLRSGTASGGACLSARALGGPVRNSVWRTWPPAWAMKPAKAAQSPETAIVAIMSRRADSGLRRCL